MFTLNTFKKKIISVGLIGSITLSLPFTVFASSYDIDYEFKYELQGSTRSFSGSNIKLTTNSSAESCDICQSFWTASLYRDNSWPIGDDFIGEAQMSRYTSDSTDWSNVGSGNYYTKFKKATDGIVVKGTGTIKN
ncbi:hypothetical protein [Paenibacillus ehimensis]|uniref:Uncharacterized protein n=1 Tax=Paenibacillus ehimensis TaxID=79264 RepID=A0ABT8VM39_9BACL|nr:hypothetical protein [Paenibacillus ehimensis]MDO3682050.1 hypothetical protein [Paenibacillus ehimensis]MEC0213573.1 hypothetical protein [Paenibacillus ehimensis]